jgi:hypothetical protein
VPERIHTLPLSLVLLKGWRIVHDILDRNVDKIDQCRAYPGDQAQLEPLPPGESA